MAQPYAAYPPAGGGYYPPGYDYSAYYQQHAYDPNAYWQHQQYHQQYGAQAQAAQPPQQQQQAAPAPPQEPDAPPLPADEPPPLPPDDAEASTAATKVQEPAAGTTASAAAAGQEQQQQQASQVAPDAPSSANASQYAAQYGQHNGHYAAAYGGYYGGYGAGQPYGAPPGYGAPGYGYPAYGSYPPASANSSYAPQVPQQPTAPYPPSAQPASTTTPAASSAAATPGRESRWNKAPPPASLPPGLGSRPTAIRPATIPGINSAAGGAGGMDAAKMAAAVSAATATAARLAAGGGSSAPSPSQQQQFIPVGGAAAAGRGGAAQPAAGSQAPGALPQSFSQYVQRALLRASGQVKQDKLKEILRTMIAEHRKAGTMWSTDWDRHPLPDLDGGLPAAARGSVFDRMASPQQKGGGSYYQQQGWGKDREGGGSRDRFRGSDDEDDSYRGGGYRGGSSHKDRARDGEGRRSKRSWDDYSRHGSGSGSDSDDERSDSYDNDGGFKPFARARSGGDEKWGGFVSKKKQRLELQAGPGRGKGRGKKQQQQAEGGRGRGRGRGNAAQAAQPPQERHYSAADLARQAARSARFGGNAAALQLAAYGWEDDGQPDGGFIVGTCQKLEKGYLRLTRPPAPDEVRPQPVLAAALARLLRMIVSKEDKYLYYNDQFKAMRQDLTVQGIKNEFTVQVYEAHARAALEYGDNAEYNQCQAQLAILYAKGLPGAHAEFGAYRLLYQAVYALHGEGRKLLGTLRQLLGNRVGQVADSPEVQHAMQVRQALANGNVLRFFQLYSSAPLLSRRLMDAAVKQLRYKALCALVRSHKPTAIALPFLARSLGFTSQEEPAAAAGSAAGLEVALGALTVDSSGSLLRGCSEQRCVGDYAPCADEAQALVACLEWCQQHGAVFDQTKDLPASVLVTKECWNKLFVPVDTSKVAHGDANLDIFDFLASCN